MSDELLDAIKAKLHEMPFQGECGESTRREIVILIDSFRGVDDPEPETPQTEAALSGAVGALRNMHDFITNGKAELDREQTANLKALLALDVSLIGKAIAELREAAAAPGAALDVERWAKALETVDPPTSTYGNEASAASGQPIYWSSWAAALIRAYASLGATPDSSPRGPDSRA